MQKRSWIILICICSILALLIGSYCVLRFGFGTDLLNLGGWQKTDGQTRYLDHFGRPLKQWQTIGEKTYYFDPETGNLHTGWLKLGNSTYYIGSNGQHTGWLELDGQLYYLNRSGVLQTGWITIENTRYYFDEEGKAPSGWQDIDGERYYLQSGAVQSGWLEQPEGIYYLSLQGTPLSGFQEIQQKKYYFNSDCLMLTGWQDIDGKRYFFTEDGSTHTGWLDWENARYYFREDGTMAIGQVEIGGDNQFFTSTGKHIMLVNRWNHMPLGYEPELVELFGYQVDPVCRDALEKMILDCQAAGLSCSINNTFRSVETQQDMWDTRLMQRQAEGMSYEEAVEKISETLAFVGASEHHLGLAVDINGAYDWLAEHCWDYGFILRYPPEKKDITGIIYEPWHFRYVGTELSKELQELGLCLEEYMQMLTEKQAQQ